VHTHKPYLIMDRPKNRYIGLIAVWVEGVSPNGGSPDTEIGNGLMP
jgi:hypothetical protein